MAKRRIEKDEKTEEGFSPPKFNEQEFLKKEKEKIRSTFIAFLFGLVIAIISFGFWTLLQDSPFQWMLVVLFGLFTAAWLRYFFNRFNIAVEDLERRGMFTSYAIYFLTWLFVLIILVNPPFYDGEAPSIDIAVLPPMQEPGGTIKIVAFVTDNAQIQDNQVDFTLIHNLTTIEDITVTLNEGIFIYEFENFQNETGDFSFTITAYDTSGYQSQETGDFQYNTDVIKIPEPYGATTSPGPVITYTTDIKIDIKPEVNWVYYTIDSQQINVTKEQDDQFYITSPIYEGWQKNTETSIQVFAKTYHYFDNVPIAYNNTIIDTSQYYFNVSGASEIGTEAPPDVILPSPRYIQVPGFETLLFLISLIGVVLIFIYKKKHGPFQS